MKLSLFDFPLNEHLIAVKPAEPRDHSRLMVVRQGEISSTHHLFHEIVQFFNPGDVLVLNRTKVRPVHLSAQCGGRSIDVLLVAPRIPGQWEVMVKPFKHLRRAEKVEFPSEVEARVSYGISGEPLLTFSDPSVVEGLLRQFGEMPLPPYILKRRKKMNSNGWKDHEWYQTVYAEEEGAIAAPTAGLHFTEAVLNALRQKGVEIGWITLHVGAGTFLPVRVEEVEEHRMLPETVEVGAETVQLINQTKTRGSRVFAVGTTVVRALESAALSGSLSSFKGMTDIFMYPGFEFKVIDGLLTNFHLPCSTPLVLVSAFAGRERVMAWYAEASAKEYRWLSYGDAMLILP